MSAGAFVRSRYEADNGDIHPIRVQPETLAASLGSVNAAPAGTVDVNLFARARKSRRAFGLGARTVRIRFTATPPAGYAINQILTVPVLTLAVYNAIVADTAITYLGVAAEVVGVSPESRR